MGAKVVFATYYRRMFFDPKNMFFVISYLFFVFIVKQTKDFESQNLFLVISEKSSNFEIV